MKKFLAIIIGVLLPFLSASYAFAQNLDPCQGDNADFTALCNLSGDNAGGVISNVILAIFIIAVVIALFFLIWGGIKWITSGGDKAKVEGARSTIIAAIVGLVLVFLSYFMLQLVLGLFGIDFNNLTLPTITGSGGGGNGLPPDCSQVPRGEPC